MIELGIVPRVGVMAVVAGIAASNVGCGLTFCDRAVMTRATRAKHGIVVDSSDILEAGSCMAIFTHIRGVNVRGVLTGGVHAVMAARAVACYCTVIKLGITPRVGVMAVIASVAASNVGCGLAFCDRAVMTRATRAKHGVVVDPRHILECRGRVAIFADIRGVNVRGVLTGGVHTIVTRGTVARDGTVIKLSITPRISVVAVVTSLRTLYMCCRFTLSNRSIVA